MDPLVSIIVPVYNGEAVLERCLDSLLTQTYRNLEVLLINDGSTDASKKILENYQRQDPRIQVIHKANGGVSETRNRGILMAKGQYLQFVDCDDWLTPDATQSLVEAISQGCEMAICDYYRVIEQNLLIRGEIDHQGVISRADFALEMMRSPANYYYGVLWNKLFVADLVRTHGLCFSKELDWCEDFQFNMEYLQYVKHVAVLPRPLYYYVRTKGSLSTLSANVKDLVPTKIALFNYYKALYEAMDLYEENKLRINRFYIDFARDRVKSIEMLHGVPISERKRKQRTHPSKKKQVRRAKKRL